jgi:pimeloyl-ACP methyl ester carboxylesterase
MRDELTNNVIAKPKLRHMLTEGRTLFELGATSLLMPALMQAPRGDGHPVVVLPGFLASDISTKPLRTFLNTKGYKASGWGLGRNLGTHIRAHDNIVSDELLDKVLEQFVKYNQKVSLIGWSLGGILSREIARVAPDCIRQVITLGSPFNGPKGAAPVAAKLFEMINGNIADREPELMQRLLSPPPVPSTAIYSRSDGVAHWESCMDNEHQMHEHSENIEVKGSHMGLGHNAHVIWIVSNRLAQKQGEWKPYNTNKKQQRGFAELSEA